MMTTIRTRLPLPLIVLAALAPFLITGIWCCGPQFMRLEKAGATAQNSSVAPASHSNVTLSGESIEGNTDEMISHYMNHESAPTANTGVLCFFFAIHGLVIGGFAGAMKAKLI